MSDHGQSTALENFLTLGGHHLLEQWSEQFMKLFFYGQKKLNVEKLRKLRLKLISWKIC